MVYPFESDASRFNRKKEKLMGKLIVILSIILIAFLFFIGICICKMNKFEKAIEDSEQIKWMKNNM